jgi:hypothetical protein
MFLEKLFRRTEPIRTQFPKPSPTDFGARAIKTKDRTFGMLLLGPRYQRTDAHPIPRSSNFAERNPDLRHAERSRIHAEKHDALPAVPKSPQVFLVSRPCVGEWVVGMRDGRAELQPLHLRRQFTGGGDELFDDVGRWRFQNMVTIFYF